MSSENKNETICPVDPITCQNRQKVECYDENIEDMCCHTCEDFNTGLQGCEWGNRNTTCHHNLTILTGHQCYNGTFRHDCCSSCHDIATDIQGCEYGNKNSTCHLNLGGNLCYNSTFRLNCCLSCFNMSTQIQGCQYGDKINYCREDNCVKMGSNYRDSCCMTCNNVQHTTYLPTHAPTTRGNNATNTAVSPSAMPGWIVSSLTSAGGVVFLLLIIVAIICVCVRRKRRRLMDHLSPINERSYNDYKMSKRPPVAPPRHPDMDRKTDWKRKDSTDSAEYAYINPNDVKADVTLRHGDDPLQPPPGVYLEFSSEDHTEYVDTIGDGKLFNGKEEISNTKQASPKINNTYNSFPGEDIKCSISN